jgi:hypothetical protein
MKAVSVLKNVDAAANAPHADGKVRAVLRELTETCPDPGKLVELYYWSAEPDLLETLHRFLDLPEEPREVLRAFLATIADSPESVDVAVSPTGAVTLSSPAVAQLMSRKDAVS